MRRILGLVVLALAIASSLGVSHAAPKCSAPVSINCSNDSDPDQDCTVYVSVVVSYCQP